MTDNPLGPLEAYRCARCFHLNLRWQADGVPPECERCGGVVFTRQKLRRDQEKP